MCGWTPLCARKGIRDIYRYEQGTTLVETLTTLAIASILVTGMVTLYDSACQCWASLSLAADCQYTARSAIEQMRSDIYRAATAEIFEEGLVLVLTSTDQEIKFYAQNARLYRHVSTSRGTTAVPIAEHVGGAYFSGGDELVYITLSIDTGNCVRTLSTAANPRL